MINLTLAELEQNLLALEQKNNYYKQVFKQLHCLVYIFDLESRKITWKNKEPKDFLWDVEGINAEDYTLEDFTKVARENRDTFLKSPETFIQKAYKILPFNASKELHVCEVVFPLDRDTNGNIKTVVGLSGEITEQMISIKGLHKLVQENAQMIHQLKIQQLSDKEQEILKLLVEGLSTKTISEKLRNSHNTIKTHRSNIMSKLGASSIVELIKFATETGLYN